MSMVLLRGRLLSFRRAPLAIDDTQSYLYIEDGGLLLENGRIAAIGDYADIREKAPEHVEEKDHRPHLIVPGLIDMHLHFPQMQVIGSYAANLLEWLNTYTFPEECRFVESAHAQRIATHFYDELLRHGTTTAAAYCSVHKTSADAFFTEAMKRNMLMVGGKVMMDRNAPDYLTDTAESGYAESRALIERWHGKGRLHYAVTPRFAPTSTPQQLQLAGQLLGEHEGLYMHTHLSENLKEIEWVKSLFPEQNGYLDVYDHFKLLGERSVFAHGVHLCDAECQRLAETGSAVAFCPTSNLFLGSGLFNLPQAEQFKVKVGLGTDVGAGTSFSLLNTLNEAYKVMQLQGARLHPFKSLYLATLGGARALSLDDRIGSLKAGNDADFVVLDYKATPLLDYRLQQSNSIEETLFVLTTLGDDRTVRETFAAGNRVHQR